MPSIGGMGKDGRRYYLYQRMEKGGRMQRRDVGDGTVGQGTLGVQKSFRTL